MGTKELLAKRNELLGKSMVSALEKRNFEGYYCPTTEDAVKKTLELIPEGSSVSWGGSMSIRESGLTEKVHKGNYTVIDRDLGKNPEEVFDLHRQGLLTDFYLTSTNAITEDGELVNIDGTGNRVAAICFGPKNVIVFCGMNKVAPTTDTAIARARSEAATINSMRFMGNTPCATTGKCHNCTSPDCICNQFLITRMCRPAKRIKVILIGESLGF